MQTDVDALVVVHVDGHGLPRMQLGFIGRLEVLEVSPDYVVGFSRRSTLRELTVMVRAEVPLCFLLLGATDSYLDSIDRAIVRSPVRSKNQRVRLARFWLLLHRSAGSMY